MVAKSSIPSRELSGNHDKTSDESTRNIRQHGQPIHSERPKAQTCQEAPCQEHKNVLIITYYWPPSGGAGVQRFLKFVKYFRDFGIHPIVLTCANPTYPIKDPSLANDIPEGIIVRYARSIEPFWIYSLLSRTTPEKAANPTTVLGTKYLSFSQCVVRWLRANLFVPDARLGWVPFARFKARHLIREEKIDTIITTGPPYSTHFIGSWLKKKAKVRWIADFRDPWTDIHYNRALPRTAWTRKLDEKMEIFVLKSADEVTITAPGTGRYFAQKVPRTYHTIPNGFDPDDFANSCDEMNVQTSRPAQEENHIVSPNKPERKKLTASEKPFLIRHIGSIAETSIPIHLLKVLVRFPVSAIKMEFTGECHPDLAEHIKALKIKDRVQIRPYVPHKQAIELMQQADLNVVVVHSCDESSILIPGKLFDYLKAGKPVLVIGPPHGDAAAIVRKCRIGNAYHYDDESGMAKWIQHLSQAPIENESSSRHHSSPEHSPDHESDYISFQPDFEEINQYSRKILTQRFAELIHDNAQKTTSKS